MHGSHSLRIHMATVSSRVLNSQCKLFLEEGWHSEGSGVLSLHVQTKKTKTVLMHDMLDSFYKKECLKKYKYERTYTISYAQRFE